jgi:hypothetical protein
MARQRRLHLLNETSQSHAEAAAWQHAEAARDSTPKTIGTYVHDRFVLGRPVEQPAHNDITPKPHNGIMPCRSPHRSACSFDAAVRCIAFARNVSRKSLHNPKRQSVPEVDRTGLQRKLPWTFDRRLGSERKGSRSLLRVTFHD